MIALWSCIPILPSFVWYCGRWYLWTSCHALSLFLCGYVMLFIHINLSRSMVSSLVSMFALWYILVVDLCELVSCLCLVLVSYLACCSLVFFVLGFLYSYALLTCLLAHAYHICGIMLQCFIYLNWYLLMLCVACFELPLWLWACLVFGLWFPSSFLLGVESSFWSFFS
jgi:hypothetical protein